VRSAVPVAFVTVAATTSPLRVARQSEGRLEGISWSPQFSLKPLSQIGGISYSFGTYTLDGEEFFGRGALQGLSKTFAPGEVTDAAAGEGDPVKVVGFAAPLRQQKFNGVPLWRDTRAALMASKPTTEKFNDNKQGIVFREAGVIEGTNTNRFSYATISEPVVIELADKVRTLGLWFRDLPLERRGSGLGFVAWPDGPELSIGPRQSAFDRSQLPRAIYEWRLCNDVAKEKEDLKKPSSAYEIDIGPFGLRPLRLLDLHIKKTADNWQIDATKILFTASLKPKAKSPKQPGPFEAEAAYGTGNLVAISLKAAAKKLSFADAKWEDVQVADQEPKPTDPAVTSGGVATVSFRRAGIDVTLGGDERSTGKTTALLGLTIKAKADNGGLPAFSNASLNTVLFGRKVELKNGVVQLTGGELSVTFNPPATKGLAAFAGVLLDQVTVKITNAEEWTIVLDGTMTIAAADPPEKKKDGMDESWPVAGAKVILCELGSDLRWLNQAIPAEVVNIEIDHQRGVVKVRADWPSPNKPAPTVQPIVGLLAKDAAVRAVLIMAIEDQERGKPFAFRSVSGFGELNLTSTAGPLTRFDHLVMGQGENVWSSAISVDLVLAKRRSRIRWPIGSLPATVKPLVGAAVELENLGAKVTGAALRGELRQFDAAPSLTHTFTMAVTGQAIKTSLLAVDKDRVAFGQPWSFHALTQHTLAENKQKGRRLATESLTWTSLDHVSAVDARALVVAAKEATTLPPKAEKAIFAFAARYKDISPESEHKDITVKAGLVLRAFAQAGFPVEALALELAKIKDQDVPKVPDGIIISGAGPSMIRMQDKEEGSYWPDTSNQYITKDQQGIFLALPWLGALDDDYTLPGVFEPKGNEWFDQAPTSNTAKWDAPDVDWAAGSLTTLSRRAAPVYAVTSNSAEIAALLQRAAQNVGDIDANRPLAAAEQVFLRRFSGGATLRERPIWLRSLLALRTLWSIAVKENETFGERITMVVPSGRFDGKVARMRLLPRQADTQSPSYLLAGHGQLVAIDRHITKFEDIPRGESIIAKAPGSSDVALSRMRQVARADRLVNEAVAVIVIAEEQKPQDEAKTLWIDIEVPRDLDNSALDIPIKIEPSDRLYASPALGWPTKKGTGAAASGALGMGGDWAFQDVGPDKDPDPPKPSEREDVKQFGSGLSGRTASLSLPARADHTQPFAEAIDTRSPPFYTLGRKMIFDRPAAAALPMVSPPARYLTSSGARAVVPVADELEKVLKRVVKGKAAPIVPPHLERTTFGLRPGAVQAEFDMLVFTEGTESPSREDMNSEAQRFGRPGHGGPQLLRQVRPPRGPALPRVPAQLVKSHGRRTFVEIDDLESDGRFAAPFRLFEGVASVLRRKEQSYRIRVLDMPLTPEWDQPVRDSWTQGNLTLDLSSPSYPKGKEKELAGALAILGLLRQGQMGLEAALSINRFVVPFNQAVWSKSPNGGGIRLTLHALDIAGARARLDEVDGDSEVVLQLRCGQEDETKPWGPPAENAIFELATKPGIPLTSQTWASNQVTFQTSAAHGVSVAASFTVSGSTPAGFNGDYKAIAVTNEKTLVAELTTDPGKSSGLGIVVATKALEAESRRQIALRLPVRPTFRPSLNIDMSTLVFADPSYDRELAGPGAADPQRDVKGDLLKLALDRFEYGADTPLYFAFGAIDATTGFFDEKKPTVTGSLQLQRQPFKNENDAEGKKIDVPTETLTIAGIKPDEKIRTIYPIDSRKAYGITFDQLRHDDRPVPFADGDEIVVSVTFDDPDEKHRRTLSCRAKVVTRPIIAPPPAVYSLVVPGKDKTARVSLHATAPLPQRIEFPDLLGDLAIGHVRRQALFTWPTSTIPAQAPESATLVKIDRAGGGSCRRARSTSRRGSRCRSCSSCICCAPPRRRARARKPISG
jgi:hypothetical protein